MARRHVFGLVTLIGIIAVVPAVSCSNLPLLTVDQPGGRPAGSVAAGATGAPATAPASPTAAVPLTRPSGTPVRGADSEESSTAYYVSPDGSDSNPGTEAQPFKTIERARQAVRATIASGMSSDITVLIRGGKYFLSSTLSFDEQDSGRDGYEVVYRNYPTEEPILIGGTELGSWVLHAGNIYKTNVGSWKFYNLMENGVPSTMARHPNSGFLDVAAQITPACLDCPNEFTFAYGAGDLPGGFDYSDAQIYNKTGGPNWMEWWTEIMPILNIDWGTRQITVKKYATWWPIKEDDRYYARGSMDFLDAAGEFYLDESAGWLYYWPRNTPIGSQEVVAPTMHRIIEVVGSSVGSRVESIRFENLVLRFSGLGEGVYMSDPANTNNAIVYMENVEDITVWCCTIQNAGYDGIALQDYAQDVTINGNTIENVGRNGISLTGLAEDDIRYVNRSNTISNNSLSNGYLEYADGSLLWLGEFNYKAAILLNNSGDNQIIHNEIVNWPYMGIGAEWADFDTIAAEVAPCPACWDYLHTRDNYIAFNDISYVVEDANDGGGFYNFGGGQGNVLDNNLIHDIESPVPNAEQGIGIYMDERSANWTIKNNIVYGIDGTKASAMILKGPDNEVTNNIFVDNPGTRNGSHMHIFAAGARLSDAIITKNIGYQEDGYYLYYFYNWTASRVAEADYNLFYHPSSNDYYVRQNHSSGVEISLADWQSLGYDTHSVTADPLFTDRLNHNYTVLPGSPALALGFENIDTSNIGRVDDPCWPDGTPTPTPPGPTLTPTITPTPHGPTLTPTITPTPTVTPSPTSTPAPTTTPTPRTVISYYLPLISLVPGIDGDLGEWGALPAVVLDADTADYGQYWCEVPDSADASAILRSGWDDDFLYFAIEVRDDVLVADSAYIWQDDGIELGIDGLYDHISSWFDDDHQFTLTFDGRVTDFGVETDVATAVTSTLDGGWALEVAIAAEGLGAGPLTVGKAMGFTFGLHDDDDGGDYESHLIWEGDSTNDSSAEYGALVFSRTTPTPTPTPPTVTSYFLPAVPDINGDLSEWGTLPAVVLDVSTADWVDPREVPDPADASAILRSGWDDEFLYFAVEIRDDVLVADSAYIWQDDGIELGIDGLYDHISSWFDDDHQFTLTFDGRVTDFGEPTDAVIAVTGTLDGGWALEVAIAAEGLGAGPLTAGKAMGFTFGLHDDDDGGDWESYLVWEGSSTNDSSAKYGRLLLTLAPASLGGFAWNDTDADHVQDGVENGISGVTLVLYDIVNDLVASAVTDANGFCRFEGLSPGIYTVMATKPPGYRFTTAATVVRSVESGDQDLTVGFGFVATTAVTLVSFEAEVWPEGVVVSWRTLGEQGITAFHLRRALSQFGPWMDVTDGPIPAQGMSGVMATYRVVDDEAERGLTYYYRLVTTPDGQEFGPIRVEM